MKNYVKYLIFIMIVCLFVYLFYAFSGDPVFRGRKELLQQTDYHALLKAGRELISEIKLRDSVSNYDRLKSNDVYIPKDVNIPETLYTLRRKLSGYGGLITIYHNSCLRILFTKRETGIFGVIIFSDGFKGSEWSDIYGDKMLIPGLWYFDSEFSPEYDKKIENMIKKNKYLKND